MCFNAISRRQWDRSSRARCNFRPCKPRATRFRYTPRPPKPRRRHRMQIQSAHILSYFTDGIRTAPETQPNLTIAQMPDGQCGRILRARFASGQRSTCGRTKPNEELLSQLAAGQWWGDQRPGCDAFRRLDHRRPFALCGRHVRRASGRRRGTASRSRRFRRGRADVRERNSDCAGAAHTRRTRSNINPS